MRLCCLLLLLALVACSEKKETESPYDSFIYSYTDGSANFSLKFNDGDTVYFRKRFPNPPANFYALVKNKDKDSLIALTNSLNFSKYTEASETSVTTGGIHVVFSKIKDGNKNVAHAYGGENDNELLTLGLRINMFAKRFDFKPTDKTIDFGEQECVELPPVTTKK
jgi:hypothetical protein